MRASLVPVCAAIAAVAFVAPVAPATASPPALAARPAALPAPSMANRNALARQGLLGPMSQPNPFLMRGAGFAAGSVLRPHQRVHGFGPVYGYGPVGAVGSWAQPAPSTTVIVIERPPTAAQLPTAADLPVSNVVRQPAGAPLLYVVNDLSQGRSGRSGGAKIISAGPARALDSGAAFEGGSASGPRIIELNAQ